MKTIKFYAMSVMAIAMLASCDNDDDTPEPVEEEEAITEVILTFENEADSDDEVILTWEDENGDETVQPSEQTVVGTFTSGAIYEAEIELFNEDEDFLDEDITADQASIDAHFFVYATTLDFTMMRASDDDERTDGNKLGVETVWTAGAAGTGTISIELHHESPSVNDSDGFGMAAGDDTDISISFNAEIQ